MCLHWISRALRSCYRLTPAHGWCLATITLGSSADATLGSRLAEVPGAGPERTERHALSQRRLQCPALNVLPAFNAQKGIQPAAAVAVSSETATSLVPESRRWLVVIGSYAA